MIDKRKPYEKIINKVRRDIENGKYDSLPSGRRIYRLKRDKKNVLFKGYPRRCKLERIMRYSRLTMMGLRTNY